MPISESWLVAFERHLLDAGLEPARRHGDLSVKLAHVGLDVRHQLGRRGFETFHGEAPHARMHERFGDQHEDDRDEKPDPQIDDRFTHVPGPVVTPTGTPPVTSMWGYAHRLAILLVIARQQSHLTKICGQCRILGRIGFGAGQVLRRPSKSSGLDNIGGQRKWNSAAGSRGCIGASDRTQEKTPLPRG